MAIRKLYSIFTMDCDNDTEIRKSLNLLEYDYYERLFDLLELETRFLRMEESLDDMDNIKLFPFYYIKEIKNDIKKDLRNIINKSVISHNNIIEVFIINEQRELEQLDIIEEAWKAIEWYYNNIDNGDE